MITIRPSHFHKYMKERFKEEADSSKSIICNRRARRILSGYQIPKDMQVKFLDEMESMNLIKRNDKRNIIVEL